MFIFKFLAEGSIRKNSNVIRWACKPLATGILFKMKFYKTAMCCFSS